MPVYNAVTFLSEAVQSVVDQDTEEPWELLIIDDGSTDGSLQRAWELSDCLPGKRIRVLCHAGHANLGTSASRNVGLAQASAPLLAFLDADDVWLPHMLRTQLALLRRYPQAAMVYANAERAWNLTLPAASRCGVFGPNELPPLLPPRAKPGLLRSPEPLYWFLTDESYTPCTCTVLVRTEIARQVGGFHEDFQGLFDDQVFYAKVALNHQIAVADRCVARYRRHAGSCCVQAWEDAATQNAARLRFERWLETYQSERQCSAAS